MCPSGYIAMITKRAGMRGMSSSKLLPQHFLETIRVSDNFRDFNWIIIVYKFWEVNSAPDCLIQNIQD
jgi:hypothetical protein